jgi:molybdate transport system substrate-binding protein
MWSKIAAAPCGLLLGGLLLSASAVNAAEIKVIASTAMREAMDAVAPQFERDSGHKLAISFESGATLPKKVKDGAQADLVITTPATIDDLADAGKVVAGTRVDFVRSGAGMAVRFGAPKPDIGTPEAFKAALLAAKTVAYSQGPSGVHFLGVLAKLGITDQIKLKAVVPPIGQRVGTLVSAGVAEVGVQQITELLLIPGVDFVGPFPRELQANIVYATVMPTAAKEKDAAAAFVKYLGSPANAPALKKLGLDPM